MIVQVVGLLAICFGVGMLAGAAWALIVGGGGAIVGGALNETP